MLGNASEVALSVLWDASHFFAQATDTQISTKIYSSNCEVTYMYHYYILVKHDSHTEEQNTSTEVSSMNQFLRKAAAIAPGWDTTAGEGATAALAQFLCSAIAPVLYIQRQLLHQPVQEAAATAPTVRLLDTAPDAGADV